MQRAGEPRRARSIARRAPRSTRRAMRVRFDRALVTELIAKAPPSFTLARPQSRTRRSRSAGATVIFSSVGGPAYVMDQRPRAAHRHLCRDVRLSEARAVLNILHQEGGGPFEPLDLPADTRHLDLYYAEITLLDKNWQPQTLGTGRAIDALGDGGDLARPHARDRWSTCRCSPASSTPIRRCSSTCRWRKG